jgi:hypothetical protein
LYIRGLSQTWLMKKLSNLIYNKPLVFSLWFGLSFIMVVKGVLIHASYNNYQVFKYNFIHTVHQQNLFAEYPQHYFDLNHYGPVFSLIIAPFTFFPDNVGVVLWVMFNAFVLFKAIQLLPLKENQYVVVLLICAHELLTASANLQSNPMVAGLIILSFAFIKRKQDFWAALMIALGAFIKLYGIVGLAFFFFSDNKLKFIAGLIFWSVVLFLLPMLISSPAFIVQTYHDWYIDLIAKNNANATSTMQGISVMGFLRKILNWPGLENIYVIAPAILFFGLSYLRIKCYKITEYQLLILASALIFTVIFSSSAESSTYIIAFPGVAIWFMCLKRPVTWYEIVLLVAALLLTSLSPSDLFPKYVRVNYVMPYRLKALPCFLIWLKIIYETYTRDFSVQKQVNVA